MGGGVKIQNTHLFFENVEIYALFGEDQMDPESTVGGPKPISRTGCVGSIINFHPRNQDVDFVMLEMCFSF